MYDEEGLCTDDLHFDALPTPLPLMCFALRLLEK